MLSDIEPRRAAKALSRVQLAHLAWLYDAGAIDQAHAVTLDQLPRKAKALQIGVLRGHGLVAKNVNGNKRTTYFLTAAGVARAESEKGGHDPRAAALKVA